jgi:uncharacterized protein YggT (Ycf19 family)
VPEPDDRHTIPKEIWSQRQDMPDRDPAAPPNAGDDDGDRPASAPHPAETASRSRLSRRYLVLKMVQTVWLVAVILEGLIGIRILLHLFNASREATFYRLIHAVTAPALFPFADLVPTRPLFGGVLEVSALVAMAVYLLLTLVIVRSLRIFFLWPPR